MPSNAATNAVLQSYKRTRSNCPDHADKLSAPTATIRGWGKMPRDVLRSDLTPAAKLVFAALAAELFRRETVEMTYSEIGACCDVGERQVRRSVKALVAKGLVERRGLSAGRVFQYRLLHAEFSSTKAESPMGERSVEAPKAMLACAKCHLPRPRLHRSGLCRGCKADMDLAMEVRAVCAELGPGASFEQIGERLKQIAEDRGRKRLTARVRRVIEAVA